MQQSSYSMDSVVWDDSPVAALYQRHSATIFAYLRMHLPTAEEAEDLLLDVFLAALESKELPGLSEVAQRVWLHKVARFKLIDRYRHVKRFQFVNIKHVEHNLYEDDERTPERMALRREEYTQVLKLLQSLPEQQQQVMRLRFVHGLQSAEIATVLGKKAGAVRMLLVRAMKQLRTVYANE